MNTLLVVDFDVWFRRNWDDVRRDCPRCKGLGLELCSDCGGYGVVLALHGNNRSIENVPCDNTLLEDANVHIQICEACLHRAYYLYERDMKTQARFVEKKLCFDYAELPL